MDSDCSKSRKEKNMLVCIQSLNRWKDLENMEFVLFYPVISVFIHWIKLSVL